MAPLITSCMFFVFFSTPKVHQRVNTHVKELFLSDVYFLHFFFCSPKLLGFFAFIVSCALTFFFFIFFSLFFLLLSLQASWSLMTSQRFLPASLISTSPVMETRSPPSQPMPSMTTVILVTTQSHTHLQSDFHNFHVYVSQVFVNQWVESIFCM